MIIKRTASTSKSIYYKPLAYEYNSIRKSVILLKEYVYTVFIDGKTEIVDLKTQGDIVNAPLPG